MIELNREKSDEKIAAAKLAIRKMLEDGDRISIPQLMKMTGLSRGFFYKNPVVRAEINQALEQQAGTIDPRRNILDKAMGGRIELLEQQIRELKQENERLQKENQKLRKGLGKQDRKAWKNL
jgi:predicted RNase H-like nuclease (RuvC/YqgF family)